MASIAYEVAAGTAYVTFVDLPAVGALELSAGVGIRQGLAANHAVLGLFPLNTPLIAGGLANGKLS